MTAAHFPIELNAGRHDRNHCPVLFELPGSETGAAGKLVAESGSETSVQILSNGLAAFVLNSAAAFESVRCRYVPAASVSRDLTEMRIVDTGSDILRILCNDEVVTEYCFSPKFARPFFFPLNNPAGCCVTRSYPMQVIPHETADHPHHRSLWIAHGSVNGTDNWSEEAGHGFTRHQSIDEVDEGPVVARFRTTSLWCDVNDRPILTQYLTAAVWHGNTKSHILDCEIELAANILQDDITFGDTKEGGILSARIASALDATRGGSIRNVYGGRQEAECWGKHSHWCSYHGTIDHKPCGVAVFDHPDGFRSPTSWHVRDYGLMTANPFGYSEFTHGRLNGTHVLRAGDSLKFKYRVFAHCDSDIEARCSQHYIDYAFPPRVTVPAT